MSSRVFQAKTGHTTKKPQLCGLTGKQVQKGDFIMYLVCHGSNARPEYQIKVVAEREVEKEYYVRSKRRKVKKMVTERDYGMNGTTFRTTFDGWVKNEDTGKREKNFVWQEQTGIDAEGNPMWRTVKCWSHIAHAEAAEALGYDVRADAKGKWVTTVALEGDRAVGSEHSVETEEDNAMVVLARAACSDEELGLVPPSEEPDGEAIAAVADEAEEERLDAEALGMTVEEYRGALARNAR